MVDVAKGFETLWNFSNYVGSMDGKHIMLQTSINNGRKYYNYKDFFSIVLFALVDEFRMEVFFKTMNFIDKLHPRH